MIAGKRIWLLVLAVTLSFLWTMPVSADQVPVTRWSVAPDKVTIKVATGVKDTVTKQVTINKVETFTAKGVDYGVVPINDNGKSEPYQDYFWGKPDFRTYGLIWWRDVASTDMVPDIPHDGFLRQLGANSIRTYAWWKHTPTDPTKDCKVDCDNIHLWKTLDWSVSDPASYGSTRIPKNFAVYPAHDGHDMFLDLCYNKSDKPIYVLIGIGIDPSYAFPMTNPADKPNWSDTQQFMLKTAEWLAVKYGDHPGVMGFVIGNETNSYDTVSHLEYWQYLNSVNKIIKKNAPGKITLSAFQDDETIYTKPLVQYSGEVKRGAATVDVYIDATGSLTTDKTKGIRRATPIDVYELDAWGFNPYNDPSAPGNVIPNFKDNVIQGNYASPANPKPKPLLLTEWGAPASKHSTDNKGNLKQWHDPPNSDLVEEAPADTTKPPSYNGATGYQAALVIRDIAKVINDNLTTQTDGILSGGYVFEYIDEWWKNNPNNNSATLYSHDANSSQNTWGTGSSQFTSYWDEEWFGLLSTAADPKRLPNGKPSDPVINQWGWMNGGADDLTKRAGFYALQEAFNGFHDPLEHPTKPPKLDAEDSAQGRLGKSFFHGIEAGNSPTRFVAGGLPQGLSIDTSQGIVHGVLLGSGLHEINITAYNEVGYGKQKLSLYVNSSPPRILNSGVALKTRLHKKVQTFKVKTNDASAKIDAIGLPPGLTINEKTGILKGIPKKAGIYVVALTATNDAGTANGKFTMWVLP